MSRARLVYGHGTSNALDEAAFLILSSLDLPIEDINPWLDCRLTSPERECIASLISRRIETRKPAAYLTNTAYIQGCKFYVDERVIVPRSFIGELSGRRRLAAIVPDPLAVTRVLDLCTGSGCLAILAAEAFPNAEIDASDISDDALAVGAAQHPRLRPGTARPHVQGRSVRRPSAGSLRFDHRQSALRDRGCRRGVSAGISGRAAARASRRRGRARSRAPHFARCCAARLSAERSLVVEIGDGQEALEAARPDLPFLWLDTETSKGEVFALFADDLMPRRVAKAAAKRQAALAD